MGPGERSFVEYIGLQSTLEADDGREGAGVYFRCTMYDDASHTAENFWSYVTLPLPRHVPVHVVNDKFACPKKSLYHRSENVACKIS